MKLAVQLTGNKMYFAKSGFLAASFCLLMPPLTASADVIYKCSAGRKAVYQDMPCKSAPAHANVLTPRNSRGTMNFVSDNNTVKPDLGPFHAADIPRPKPVNIQAVEEKQRLLGKPSVKQQLETPTPIEARSHGVWENVKQWFRGWMG